VNGMHPMAAKVLLGIAVLVFVLAMLSWCSVDHSVPL
jgi:hypothetical protein